MAFLQAVLPLSDLKLGIRGAVLRQKRRIALQDSRQDAGQARCQSAISDNRPCSVNRKSVGLPALSCFCLPIQKFIVVHGPIPARGCRPSCRDLSLLLYGTSSPDSIPCRPCPAKIPVVDSAFCGAIRSETSAIHDKNRGRFFSPSVIKRGGFLRIIE